MQIIKSVLHDDTSSEPDAALAATLASLQVSVGDRNSGNTIDRETAVGPAGVHIYTSSETGAIGTADVHIQYIQAAKKNLWDHHQ